MPSPHAPSASTADAQTRMQPTLPSDTDVARAQKTTTKTITLISTIAANEPGQNQHSPPAPAPAPLTIDTIRPNIHGIIPGLHYSHPLPLSLSTTSSPPPPTTLLHQHTTRRSNYPRPSPPGFLYPAAIVPAAAYAAAQNNNQNQNLLQDTSANRHAGAPRDILGRMDYSITYLPVGLKICLLLVIAVMSAAVLWCVLVWMVNFPPSSWEWVQKTKSKSKKKIGIMEQMEQKVAEEREMQHCSATTTALDTRFSIGSSTLSSHIASPSNPYLAPAPTSGLTHRTSSKWLRARAAFFLSTSNPPSPSHSLASITSANPSTSTSSTNSWTNLDASDITAMEAGTAPLTGFARDVKTDSEESMVLKWFEGGLGMMDGAVDRVVDRVVRWTDDRGEEPLLLPVAEGRGCRVG